MSPNDLPGLLQARFTAETWPTKISSFACAQKFGTTVGDAQSSLESAKDNFCTPAHSNKQQVRFMSSLSTLQKSSTKALKLDPIANTGMRTQVYERALSGYSER